MTTTTRPIPTLARSALLIAVVTAAARLVGFVRVVVFAHAVGPTCLGDAYYTANTVPNILFDVVAGGALASLVVPLLAGAVDAGDRERADRTASALLTWTVLLLVPVFVIGTLLAGPVIGLLVGNGHPGCAAASERAVGARMLAVFMPQVVLYGIAVVFTGALQAHRRFLAPAVAPLASSLVVIAAYAVFGSVAASRETGLSTLTRGHELILSIGTTLGVVALVAAVIPSVRASGLRWRPTLSFPAGAGRAAVGLAVAGAVALGAQDLATGAILRLANDRGANGAVVLYTLTWTVFLLPWAVLAVPVATAAFPGLVARWQAGDHRGFAASAAATTRTVLLATAGAAAVLVAVARPAARVVVLGAPGAAQALDLAHTFTAFAPGLIGYGLVAHLSRVHYARGDARTPAVATAGGWALVVAVDVVLVLAMPRSSAAVALGLGTSVGMSVAALAMALLLGAHTRPALAGVGRCGVAGLASGAVAAGCGWVLAAALPSVGVAGSAIASIGVGAVAAAIFVGGAYLLDRPTVLLIARRRLARG